MRVYPAFLAPVLSFALLRMHPSSNGFVGTVAPLCRATRRIRATTQGWVDTKLYFGLDSADAPGVSPHAVSESQWRVFLDREVTPRFPAGLSVVDVYGQWQGKSATAPSRLRSKMLIIDYPDTQENRDKIEAIRSAWKQQTGHQSVLRVTEPADVSF